MSVVIPVLVLLAQLALLELFPPIADAAGYIIMVAAPLAVAIALLCSRRGDDRAMQVSWYAIATSLVLWSLGAFGNLWQELVLGRTNDMYRGAMLAFDLSGVPITFVLAGEWRIPNRRAARIVDAIVASVLGLLFFQYIWTELTARGAPDEIGVHYMVRLFDLQNALLALAGLARWYAADGRAESRLFRALFVYLAASLVLSFINDHYLAGNPAFGAKEASIISICFALLYVFAFHPSSGHFPTRTDLRVARIIRAASASLLPAALLLVSLFLIRIDYASGLIGIIVAVVGYTLRNALNQESYIARGEILQKERSELQTIAWNDSLTGLANRLFLDQNLNQIARPNHPLLMPLSILMIDIDYFKMLNDRYGHPTGDACLRSVADALRGAMARPGDILARYGGEEFLAVMVGADGTGALRIAERLRQAVETLNIENLGSPLGRVTVSVGTASALAGDRTGASGLIAAADRTLYEAKRAGRNQIRGIVLPVAKPFS